MLYPIIDVETTGLDEDRGDLLEVACIMYDSETGKTLDRDQWVVYYPTPRAELMWRQADQFVRDMHDANGLWGGLHAGQPLVDVDATLAHMLAHWKHCSGQGEMHLVGNSCRLDLNFIERHLPLTYAELHYRSIDLSGIWLASVAAKNEYVFDKSTSEHRAMADCEQTLRQFKMTLERMSA